MFLHFNLMFNESPQNIFFSVNLSANKEIGVIDPKKVGCTINFKSNLAKVVSYHTEKFQIDQQKHL